MSDFERLFVMWREPESKARHVIGRLTASRGRFRFWYTIEHPAALAAAGFHPLIEFPDTERGWQDPHESLLLFPTFAQRVPGSSRPDFGVLMEEWGVMDREDPMEVLARSGGILATDPLELAEFREISDSLERPLEFRLAATAHFQPLEAEIQPGAGLQLRPHAENPMDPHAVYVVSGEEPIGYIPRQYSQLVATRLAEGAKFRTSVIREMPSYPDQRKWLLRLERE